MNKFIKLSAIVFTVFLISQVFLVSIANASEDSWTTKKAMLTGRVSCGSVAAPNGLIYVIGGSQQVKTGSSTPVGTNEAYDPKTDTWATKKAMPTPRDSFGIVIYQNKIYIIGGSVGGGSVTGVTEVYDTTTDTWETKTSMPTARSSLRANIVDGKIYMIGGLKPIDFSNVQSSPGYVNEVYDIATDTWTSKSLPSEGGLSSAYASAVIDNKIYLFTSDTKGKSTLIYDTERDLWSYGKPIPIPVMGIPAGATMGEQAPKRIYVIGATNSNEPEFTSVQIYDPETDSWSMGTPMPTSRIMSSIAVMNDYIYVFGGTSSDNERSTVANEMYTPARYKTSNQPINTILIIIIVIILTAGTTMIALRLKKRRHNPPTNSF